MQLLTDCAPNGDISEDLPVLKEFHASLIDNSPAQWQSAIGTFSDWTERFKLGYQRRVKKEMLSLSGAFPELIDSLGKTTESDRLAEVLIQIAKAGNEEILQTWVKPLSFETGTYSLPRILEKLAKAYLDYYQKMNAVAADYGIQAKAAQDYRLEAIKIRNRKMMDIFRTPELQQQLNAVVQDYMKNGDASAIHYFIEQKVNASRRNFKDAAPFTVVSRQSMDEKTGRMIRQVYNAKKGRFSELTLVEVTPLEKRLHQQAGQQGSGHAEVRCEGIFFGL